MLKLIERKFLETSEVSLNANKMSSSTCFIQGILSFENTEISEFIFYQLKSYRYIFASAFLQLSLVSSKHKEWESDENEKSMNFRRFIVYCRKVMKCVNFIDFLSAHF